MKLTLSLALLALFTAPACALAEEAAPVTSSGKVHWHRSLAEAVEAAAKTGKPVLHFQLLGDLDQEFC